MTQARRSGPVDAVPLPDQGLLAAFRALTGGGELHAAGAAVLEHACRALRAEEAAILLADPRPGSATLLEAHYGLPGPEGRLGTRPLDSGRTARAVAAVGPATFPRGDPLGDELWCPMLVEGRAVGAIAVRRRPGLPFAGADRDRLEALAHGAALAADRLRFLRLWSEKLDQADAAHSQLLRYADELRTTYAAERRRAEQLREALEGIELAYTATVRALATAVEAKDAYTGGHLSRVTAYGMEVCRVLGGDLEATPDLEYAFLLHDLGKLGVPDAVLNKAGPLSAEEWALMREHPAIGLRILEGVPYMDVVREVVYCHHERWDGAGYPEGLQADAIPPAARVFAVVDAFDAMTTDRPYRAAAGFDEALARVREGSGTQFAPDAVGAIELADRERFRAIQASAARTPAGTERPGEGMR